MTHIPTCADLASAAVEDRFDDMINPPGLTNHLITAQADHDVMAVRALSAPPLAGGDTVTGQLYLGGRLARSFGRAVRATWRPDRVDRATEIENWHISTTTVCPPGEQAVLVRATITNTAREARELRCGLWTASTVTCRTEAWLQPEIPQEMNRIEVRGARRIGRSESGAVAIQSLLEADGHEVTDTGGTDRMLEVRTELGPGESRTYLYLHTLGASEDQAEESYSRIAAAGEGSVAASERAWDAEIAAMFTPGNDIFGGHLPTLVTTDESLRALYWWGAVGVLWFRRDNPASVLGRTYDTLMPRHWQTTTFLWDYSLSSLVHALLDPEVMRKQICHWVGLDIEEHFGTEWLTGGPVGNWYSVNHYAMTRLVDDYLRWHGDHALLEEAPATPDGSARSIAENLLAWARAWHRLRGESGLADYGGIDNLLECVSTYVHEVASLNGANVWNMRRTAEICEMRGQADEARALWHEADELVELVQELYVEGEGFFHARQPDGTLVETRHVYDFATVGTTIADDLPETMRREMTDFFVRELRTPSWLRALSPFDQDAGYSIRADHQWNGAYPAWPPDAARAAIALGDSQAVIDWLPGLARTANQGPPGQAHFVEEAEDPIEGGARKTPAQLPYIIDWSCSSAGAFCDMVLTGIFGVSAGLDGEVAVTGGCIDQIDPGARLEGLQVQGRLYDIVGGEAVEREVADGSTRR